MLNLLRMQCLKDSKCVLLARAPAAAGVRRLVCSSTASGRARQRASTTTSGTPTTAKRVALREFGSASGPPQKVVLLVDGNNLAMRAYFGIYKNPMSALQTTTGIPTTVSFGFMRSLLAHLEQERPDALVVVFDGPGGNAPRRELLPAYKANRTKPAPDFAVDFANLKLLLRFTRIPTLTVPGYEADDVMAGLAVQARQCGWRTLLLSTDKDLWQVVDDAGGVSVLLPASGSSSKSGAGQSYIDEAAVQETLGVRPDQVPELKALMGDSSDNIPGIPGIGIKTASALMKSHGSLSDVFANIHQEKKGVAAKLEGRQAEAELYKSLATVRPEAAPVFDFEAAHLPGFAAAEVEPLLRKLEMTSLLKDLSRMQGLMGGAAAADPQLQAALPAALQQVDASAAELQQGGAEPESGQQHAASSAPVPQPTAPASGGGVESGDRSPSSTSSTTTTTAASDRPAAHQEADDVLAAAPTVRLVRTPEDLQALLAELQQHQQVCVTWSWPQSTPYRPGDRQQPPPQLLCCAWQQLPQQSSKASVTSSTNTSSSSLLPESPAAPRRRRRTRASTSALQQHQQQSAPQPVAAGVPSSEQQQQQSGLQLAVILPGAQLPAAVMLSVLQPLLESGTHPKCLFESKRAYTELHHQGIQLAGVAYDVLVAGCLPDPTRWGTALDPERQQAAVLPAMVEHVLHTSLADLAAALQAAAPAPAAAAVDAAADDDAWVWRAAAEAWATLLLRGSFTQQMQDDGSQLQQLLDSMELPLQRVLSAMEVTGVRCDKQLLLQQRAQLQAEVDALAEQLYGLAGRRFNLNSPRECSTVIYEELGLKAEGPKGAKKTKSGFQSTSMSEIDKLEPSPFKAAFVEHARLSSLLAKFYGDGYLGAINPDTGRIHTTYQQVGIATGRLASSNPNMQAVPAHDDRGKMFRAAFTADEGHLLVSADYSQVELRVLAALSGDEGLLQAFAEDQDVHAATARVVLGKGPQDPLTAEERQLGKRVNFSIVYGAGARQLATGLGMTQKQAQAFMDSFKAAHPKLYEYKTFCMRSAVALGHTLSAAGRRRVYSFTTPALRALRGSRDLQALPDMKELQRQANRSDVHVLLQASNAPIQGTSADVLKAALLQLHTRLAGPPHFCRLMLTAHDDVVMEVPHDLWPDPVKGLVEAAMQGVLPEHRLMLRADIGAGASWLECKP